MKICIKCLSKKSLNCFYKNKSKKDGLQDYCKDCKKEQDKKSWSKNGEKWSSHYNQKRIEALKLVNDYKKERHCEKCLNKKWYSLDFHHLDPSIKEFNISNGIGYSKENLFNEIEKCIILCKNCHSEFHYLEKEEKITIQEYLK